MHAILMTQKPVVAPPVIGESSVNLIFRDDFNGSSLDSAWQQITTSRATQNTVASGLLTFEPSATGSDAIGTYGAFGYRRSDIPATGDFYIEALINTNNLSANQTVTGIFLREETPNLIHLIGRATNKFRAIAVTGYSESADWGEFNGFFADRANTEGAFTKVRLTFQGNAIKYHCQDSNGLWATLGDYGGRTRPTRMGLAMWNNDASIRADHNLVCDSFECRSIPANGTITASSSFSSPPSVLFDWNFYTDWLSGGGFPCWIQEEKATAQQCNRVFITSSTTEAQRDIANFEVRGSNNGGATWDVLGAWTGTTWAGRGHLQEFVMTSPGAYKMLRLHITACVAGNDGYTRISEIEFRE